MQNQTASFLTSIKNLSERWVLSKTEPYFQLEVDYLACFLKVPRSKISPLGSTSKRVKVYSSQTSAALKKDRRMARSLTSNSWICETIMRQKFQAFKDPRQWRTKISKRWKKALLTRSARTASNSEQTVIFLVWESRAARKVETDLSRNYKLIWLSHYRNTKLFPSPIRRK